MSFIEEHVLGLLLAIGLGLLVGLQREWVPGKPIGLRSFALISAIGGMSGILAEDFGGWLIAAGFVGVTAAILAHAWLLAREEPVGGMTTELAAMAMFLIGTLATTDYAVLAVILGGGVTLLLYFKSPLHSLIDHIAPREFAAIARFVLLSMVILPVLPDRTLGPYDVLNPHTAWLMVVLIVSINLVGYIALKFARGSSSALVTGILGGIVSSTATTVSFASRARDQARVAPFAVAIILIACGLVYPRMLVEVGAVARGLVPALAGPAMAMLALFLVVAVASLRRLGTRDVDIDEPGNPAELRIALTFAALFSVVLLVSAAAQHHFGSTALYPVAILSGLTDVDAITLSTAGLFAQGRVAADDAWRVIFVASLANLAFKGGIVAFMGGKALRNALLPRMAGLLTAGIAIAIAWP